jgi:parallel beta-helix repeat protein
MRRNYYFSTVSGNDTRTAQQAQSASSPWRTLDKLNEISVTLKPGDSVFFKRGEVFYGTINVRSSGVGGNIIYYGAYGTGSNPVISGFTTLSNWTLSASGIYYTTLDVPLLNMVTINGSAKGMGRYPNSGYLKYENNAENTSITDYELTSSPNWTGAEIVMRKYRFILDRHTVTNHSGTTLNYSTSTAYGNNSAYKPIKGNGYFFQNHLGTLDQLGEWYYDKTAKRLYVFFGANSPSGYVVKASTKDYNASVSTVSYLTFENLNFEGGNLTGLNLMNTSHTIVQNCNFYNEGGNSIYGIDLNTVTIKGGSINTSFSNGINFEYNNNNCTVDSVSIINSNTIAGTGRSGNGVSIGIAVTGNNTKIINNRVVNSGYSAIQFMGSNVLVERNFVDRFCTIKDDGGGIYTYSGSSKATTPNRKIKNNIVLNAIGAYDGAWKFSSEKFGKAAGVYLDENSNGVEVSGNTISHGDWSGIFLHNSYDNVVTGNVVYNHRCQMLIIQYEAATRNNTMTDNQYVSKNSFQNTLWYRTYVSDSPSAIGKLDLNYYARLMNDSATIRLDNSWSGGGGTSYITLEKWKASYNLDPLSKKSPLVYTSNIDSNVRFEYNATNAVKIVRLNASYIDMKRNQYAGHIGIEPFTGVVLLKTTATFLQNQVITFPDIADKTYGDAPFTLNATSTSGLTVKYRVVSGPATISGNIVTLTGVGSVTIEASQIGNSTYKPAKVVNQGFYVWPSKSQTITFTPIPDKKYGDAPFALNATASSGLPVSFQVISGLATVSGNIVTINSTAVTTIIIEATQSGNTTYKPAIPVRQSFTVSKSTQTISFSQPTDKSYGDAPFALNATVSSGLPVSYKVTSGPAIISGNIVTLTGVGSVWITASQAGNEYYEWAPSVTQTFYVSKGAQTITFPAIPNKAYGDAPFALNATASSGLPVTYKVLSGPATVQGNMVTISGIGEVWIEASQAGNTNYNLAASVGRNFFVTQPATTSTVSNLTLEESPSLSLFPNPIQEKGFIRVWVPNSTAGHLNIYDLQGKLVKQLGYKSFGSSLSAHIDVNVQELASGIYFIRFSTNKTSATQIFRKL